MSLHFPRQVKIDSFKSDGFRFADMRYQGDLLILAAGIFRFDGDILAIDLTGLDIFIYGTGKNIVMPNFETRAYFKSSKVALDPMQTHHALATYNLLLDEKRAVGAVLTYYV